MTELCKKLSTEYDKYRAFHIELMKIYSNICATIYPQSYSQEAVKTLLKSLEQDYAELFLNEL